MKGTVKIVPIDAEYPIVPGMWVIHNDRRYKLAIGTSEKTAYLMTEGTYLPVPHPRRFFTWPVIEYSQDGKRYQMPVQRDQWDRALRESIDEVEFEPSPALIGEYTYEVAEFEKKMYPESFVRDLELKIEGLQIIRKAYELIKDGRRYSEPFVIDAIVMAVHEFHDKGMGGFSPIAWAKQWFKRWVKEESWNKDKAADHELYAQVHTTLVKFADVMMGDECLPKEGIDMLEGKIKLINLANKFKAYANTHGPIIQQETDTLQQKEDNVHESGREGT